MKKLSKKLVISGSHMILTKNKPISSLETIYGIGRVRAKKISSFLMTNPNKKSFKINLVKNSQDLNVQRIFKSLKTDNQLKLLIYNNFEKKAKIGCYVARRMLQNLPAKGQRTHTNSGTPSTRNPMLSLGLKKSLTEELILNNKKWELNNNNRSTDLLDFSLKIEKRKYSKSASLAKKKKKEQKQKDKKLPNKKKSSNKK